MFKDSPQLLGPESTSTTLTIKGRYDLSHEPDPLPTYGPGSWAQVAVGGAGVVSTINHRAWHTKIECFHHCSALVHYTTYDLSQQ